MTKSTITRERLEEIILDNSASLEEFMAITRMALAAMDSEPVADDGIFRPGDAVGVFNVGCETCPDHLVAWTVKGQNLPAGNYWLYISQQPAPVVPEDARQALRKMVDEIIAELDAEESACRAAMLQAEPVTTPNKLGNSPVIPDTWIPVSERMPEDGQHIIIFCDGAFVLFAQCRDGDFFDIVRDGEDFFETASRCVTHWMPLPAAPQEVRP